MSATPGRYDGTSSHNPPFHTPGWESAALLILEASFEETEDDLHDVLKDREDATVFQRPQIIYGNKRGRDETYEERGREKRVARTPEQIRAITPNIFYSSPSRNPWPTPAEIETRKYLHRVTGKSPKEERYAPNQSSSPKKREEPPPQPKPVIIREFYKQSLAFDFVREQKKNGKHLHVFAVEKPLSAEDAASGHANGGRKYFTCTYDQLWKKILNTKEQERHFYEVIPEGSQCHMYFDLEYLKEFNWLSEENRMVDTLLRCIQAELYHQFQLQTIIQGQKPYPDFAGSGRFNDKPIDIRVVDLTSTTDAKFSRHLILRLEDTCWKDNVSLGNFIDLLVLKIKREIERRQNATNDEPGWATHVDTEDLENMFVTTDKQPSTFFADLGVYTRNRNFRLYGSSKIPLVEQKALGKSLYWLREFENEEELFYASLICNTPDTDDKRVRILSINEQKKVKRVNTRVTQATEDVDPFDGESAPRELHYWGNYATSPFPELDQFVSNSNLVLGPEKKGIIKSWLYYPRTQYILYNVQRNRFCFHIGREHKSNGIFVVANFVRGIIYQKCHDTDCKTADFRATEESIPLEIMSLLPTEAVDQDVIKSIPQANQENKSEEGKVEELAKEGVP
ncbi:coiled-coil domain-containing protein [Planoprotostelium fungivorum]|uniref:DNA-directed primase/polymerase protein n=1 Tax=Planoprotostelium fungivorum TaxID=1890364 RepID=A0A2P6NBT6_9EUKA|nr:coiled-coil domain-containing protein [Planoprotostelium fungivorum]